VKTEKPDRLPSGKDLAKPSSSEMRDAGLGRPMPWENAPQAGKPSPLGREISGVALLAAGFILLLSVLGVTHGQFVDGLLFFFKRLLGIGRLAVPLIFMYPGWLLLTSTRPVSVWRVLLTEIALFSGLAAASAFYGDTVAMVEDGSSAGGVVGWGLSDPLIDLAGWLVAGVFFALLAVALLVVGLNLTSQLERWANAKMKTDAGHLQEQTASAPAVTATTPAVVTESAAAVRPANKKPLKAADLPLAYRRGQLQESEPIEAAVSAERSSQLPPLDLLEDEEPFVPNQATIKMNGALIEKTLEEFGIPARVVSYHVGPTVTQYAIEPGYKDTGRNDEKLKVRIAQISVLTSDLALALKADRVRIEAPVPGTSYVGIEIPNRDLSIVRLRPLLESPAFRQINSPLAIALGRDSSGKPVASDLSGMPHLLIGGTTNSGKSVCVTAIATTLAMNNTPEDLRMVMIDPKMVELTRFNGLPHMLGKVETDVERTLKVLQWATQQMDIRYKILEAAHARDLRSYNDRVTRQGGTKLPHMVIFIDELADLMMNGPAETEFALIRLAQEARAVGIHLIVATQHPSVEVVTGLIKANFPTRIAFMVASSIDSRIILDENGAETLLGKGDMLFLQPEMGNLIRAQGALVTDQEIKRVVSWWQQHSQASAEEIHLSAENQLPEKTSLAGGSAPWEETIRNESPENEDENLIREATALIRKEKRANASFLQRQLHVGYPKAAWLIDQLEGRGVLGPANGGKERLILENDSQNPSLD